MLPSAWLRSLSPAVRLRVVAAAFAIVVTIVGFAACVGCGKRPAGGEDATSARGVASVAPKQGAGADASAVTLRDPLVWQNAKDGEVEDLATLAAHEGAAGLVEATSETTLRPTAIRAMGYARGWAQLPFLAKVASGKDEEEARLALDATLELSLRPRRAEDPEDAEELGEGCGGLLALARDVKGARPRRVAAIRALRMMPCPPADTKEIPTDLDTK